MTICLGALCAGAEGREASTVVVASDCMMTMGGITEFEHELPYHLNGIHSLVTSYDAVGDPDSLWTGED